MIVSAGYVVSLVYAVESVTMSSIRFAKLGSWETWMR